MEDVSLYDYSTPVFRVLLAPNQLLGIGIVPIMFILVLTIILMNLVSFWCVIVGVVLYGVSLILCRKDPYMLEFVWERMMLPAFWRAN